MERQQLHERLKELHAELEDAPSVDTESRELLRSLVDDIREMLKDSGAETLEPHGVTDQLREAARRFEESHPTLATTVGRVADALSNLGI